MFSNLKRPIKRELFDKSLKYIYNKVGRMAGNYITYRGMKAVASTPQKINNMPAVRPHRTPQMARRGPLSRQVLSFPQRKVKKPSFSATPRGTRVAVRNVGALSSKSAGRFKTKKYKITKTHRKSIAGVSATHEVGRQLVSNGQCLWVGHNSAPIDQLWLNFWRVIVKKLLDRTGFPVRNFSEVMAQITPGDIVNLSFTVSDGGSVSSANYTLTAADSVDTIVLALYNNILLRAEGIVFTQIAYLPTTNAVGSGTDRPGTKLDLEHAMLDIYCKSTMKLQNRTQNSSIDSEAVDNVPLYGKIYSGTGNGVNMLTSTSTGTQIQLIATNVNGLISGSETDLGMQEPPHAWFFPGVSKAGKAHLEPGAIKTSTLVYKKKMSINYFRKMIGRQFSLTVKAKLPFGKYTFFGLEKMIQSAAPAAGNITVGVEINHFLSMNMTLKHRSVSAMQFSSNFS